jgi:hypothetical protein
MATDRWIRASDQDRQSAVESLSEAYAVGRLRREELDERATAAYSATTWGGLRDLTADLPFPVARAGPHPDSVAARHAPPRASRRQQRDLFTTQSLDPAVAAIGGQPGLVRGDPRPPGGEELAHLNSVVHDSTVGDDAKA